MNWDAIGAVGEILGALAVVGSLIYVGRQFRHSSTQPVLKMRKFVLLLVASLVCSLTSAAEESLKQAFEESYSNYQASLKGNNIGQAAEYAEKALQLGKSLYGEDDLNTAMLTLNYATTLTLLPRQWVRDKTDATRSSFSDPAPIARLAVRRYEGIYGNESTELLSPLLTLAKALVRTGEDRKELKSVLARAEGIAETTENHEVRGNFYFDASEIAGGGQGRKWAEIAASIYSEHYGPGDLRTLRARVRVGQYQKSKKQATIYEEVIRLLGSHPDAITLRFGLHQKLVIYYQGKKNNDKVTEHLQAAGALNLSIKDGDYLPISKVVPRYPQRALNRGVTGYVLLEFIVTKIGTVENVVVIASKPTGVFDKSAIAAATKFRYIPRYVDGKPVSVAGVRNRVNFDLQ